MVCTSLETAHAAVCQLVKDFAASEAHYLSPGYSEAQARISYIDKLWQALGWDVTHEQQKNPYAQEVKVEDPQKIAGSSRRADYAFHTAPNFRDARFFCEAKKPAVQLKTDADAAFQTIRYGWNAGTPLTVLTDFEQLHILDCRAKPRIDTALARSHRYFHYKDWLDPEKFAQLYYLFSREAFASGAHDDYVKKLPRPKKVGTQLGLLPTGQQPVDAAFLLDLEGYRETLAKLLKAADHTLDGDTLTGLVQRILDRLIFLRFLEDKLIEIEIQVAHFSHAPGGHAWAAFRAASAKLDQRYNGIVFKHDLLLDDPARLPLDDARFADLCAELSHTRSPYLFNIIPIHILGSIYERFLGKVITTTEQRARVEEKPEVRKAGGVYYTPAYIVRYIVQQTVGKLIEGKTPAQIARMRFADIACGSGSFLLGLYDCLLDAHARWYAAHPAEAAQENLAPADKGKKRKKEFIPAVLERDGVPVLSFEKKRDILVNNIFGVDLDPQAVEVAQLSLYLKLLEDETTASARQHYLDFHEALLPSLSKNVVRGNSLIGTDILFGQFEFSAQEERKLAPMDFESAFPAVFPSGWKSERLTVRDDNGYHVDLEFVPDREAVRYGAKPTPKVRPLNIEGGFDAIIGNPPYGAELPPHLAPYLRAHYASIANSLDSFILFMERAAAALRPGGKLGYIVPCGWVSTPSSRKLRAIFTRAFRPEVLVSLPYDIFDGAYVDTMVVTAERLAAGQTWVTVPNKSVSLVVFPVRHKIEHVGEFADFAKPGDFSLWDDPAENGFLVTASTEEAELVQTLRRQPKRFDDYVEVMRGIETFHPAPKAGLSTPRLAFTGDIFRHQLIMGDAAYIDYPPAIESSKPLRFFSGPRVLLRQLLSRKFRLQAVYADAEFLTNQSMQSILVRPESGLSPKFIAGVLNSTLLSWYFCQVNMVARRDDFPKTIIKQTREFPIAQIDPAKNAADKVLHDRMVALIEKMLSTQQKLAAAANETDRELYQNQAAGWDRQIDELTCDLYGLTSAERALLQTPGG